MDAAIRNLNAVIESYFVAPSHEYPINNLDSALNTLSEDPLWFARAHLVRHLIDPSQTTPDVKDAVLNFYETYQTSGDHWAAIEAARAAAILEEPDSLLKYLQHAEKLLGFKPNVEGIPVSFTPHQTNPSTRVGCLAEPSASSSAESSAESSAGAKVIKTVDVNTNEERFEPPKFNRTQDEYLSTSLLNNVDYLVLLLHASYVTLSNPASTTTVVNEQVLPFIRRVTETTKFQSINFLIKERALYDRSVLELKDISELERGTLQLAEISKAVHHEPGETSETLKYFHFLVPIPWRVIDELAARRLVAMSDFANAIPYYKNLDRPLDVAICLTAIGSTTEAITLLESPELANDPKALMLRGDIGSNPDLWQLVWDRFQRPQAKLRLAQKSIADNSLEEALVHLNDLLSIQPANYEALKLAGSTALSLEKWDEAAKHLRRALGINDDDTRGWSDLATALVQLGQPQAAHHAIKQAIRVSQNSEPDIPTYTNFVGLSAQLGLYDDVLVGLSQLADAAERGSAAYVAKVSGVLPRLVSTNLKHSYSGTTSQNQLLTLFAEKLPKVIPEDDPMLSRFTGLVYIWAHKYQAGLASLNKAVDILFQEISNGSLGNVDTRLKARAQLYANELVDNLVKYGDEEGRFEGSKAFPGWAARKQVIEKKLQSLEWTTT